MVIWLEDLTNDDEDREVLERDEERLGTEVVNDGRADAIERGQDRVVDVTDDGARPAVDSATTEAAIADDEGYALTDLTAARFTRH